MIEMQLTLGPVTRTLMTLIGEQAAVVPADALQVQHEPSSPSRQPRPKSVQMLK
jgi:hypothetical protein